MAPYYHFFCSALQLGQQDLFQNQGTMHPSWKMCLQLSSLITSPLMKPFKQMEHSFSVFPIFIFLMPSKPFFPRPNNSFSRLSCQSLNCTESLSINEWKSSADMPQMGDSEGGFSSSQLQSMMALYSFCQSMKLRLYFPFGFILMGLSDIRFNNIMEYMHDVGRSVSGVLGMVMVSQGLAEQHIFLGSLAWEQFGGVSGLSIGSMEVGLLRGEIDGFVEVNLHLVDKNAVGLGLSPGL